MKMNRTNPLVTSFGTYAAPPSSASPLMQLVDSDWLWATPTPTGEDASTPDAPPRATFSGLLVGLSPGSPADNKPPRSRPRRPSRWRQPMQPDKPFG